MALAPRGAPVRKADRKIFSGSYTVEKLAAVLLPRERWKPFPEDWSGLPADLRRSLVEKGERRLGAQWAPLPATLLLEFKRTGNRSNYEHPRNTRREQLRELVLAEAVEGQGRFADDIVNGIWITCEETFWGSPAHLGAQKAGVGLPDAAEPIVDLFAAETASQLAWTDYLLGPRLDRVSPLVRPRIRLEIDRRILTPCREREDFGWMGLGEAGRGRLMNNWNPWINSNWLTCNLLLEPDAARRLAAVHKILRSLDQFLDSYQDDGGCDEGPGYWFRAGGSLFDCLELLHSATGGRMNLYDTPLIQEIGRYICRAHIHDDYFVNFADASAVVHMSGDLVFRYGRRIGDANLAALGAWAARRAEAAERGDSLGRQLPALVNLDAIRKAPAFQPLLRDVWMPGIQVMAARLKQGSAKGLYLAAQGGHNAESHNHNDVGNFIVYSNGQPVIVDVGVETYTAKTFSSRRYEIWTMQSAYHNLPTIDGVMQGAGREFAASGVAYRADDRAAELSLDISRAYPPEAALKSWKRTLRLDRAGNQVEVSDTYALGKPAGRITLTLMTLPKPVQNGPGELALGPVKVLYDAGVFRAAIEEIPLKDGRLRGAWGERLYRVLLTAEKPPAAASWRTRILGE